MRLTMKIHGAGPLRVAHRDLDPQNTDCDALEKAIDDAVKALRSKPRTTTATRLGDDARETAKRETDEG